MLKRFGRTLLRSFDLELMRYHPRERALADAEPGLTLRDAIRVRALATGGQISLAEARFLGELARQSDPSRPIIEIGTLFGYSTRVLAANKAPEQVLITVDNYRWNPIGLSRAAHRLAARLVLADAIARHNTRVVESSARDFYDAYTGPPPALFFCDADHSYEGVKQDLEWALKARAAVICGDDYAPSHEGVVRAVDELGGPARLVGGLFVLRRGEALRPEPIRPPSLAEG